MIWGDLWANLVQISVLTHGWTECNFSTALRYFQQICHKSIFNSLLNLDDKGHWDLPLRLTFTYNSYMMIHHLQSSSQRLLILPECTRLCCHVCGQVWQRQDGEFLQDFSNSLKECSLKCPSNGQCGTLRVCIHCSVDPCNWYSTGNSILVHLLGKCLQGQMCSTRQWDSFCCPLFYFI